MKRLTILVLCVALSPLAVRAENPPSTPTATQPKPVTVAPVKPVVRPTVASPTTTRKVPLVVQPAGKTAPVSANARCTMSRSQVLFGQPGLGCRETPPTLWTSQGCPANAGCCTSTSGCLVTGSANAVRGDGIY
jgi:hypothetical protein